MPLNILRIAEALKIKDVFKLAAKNNLQRNITEDHWFIRRDLEGEFQLCTVKNERKKWPGVLWRELLSVGRDGRLNGAQPGRFPVAFQKWISAQLVP